jgi:hypothetical protein
MEDQLRQFLADVESEIKTRSDNLGLCLTEIKTQLMNDNFCEVVKITVTSANEAGHLSELELCARRLRKIIAA